MRFKKPFTTVNRSGNTAGYTFIYDTLSDRTRTSLYYDFTKLTGTNGTAISNGNAGLVDQSGNGHTATIINTPVIRDVSINGSTIKTLHDESTNCVNTNTTGASFLGSTFNGATGFEIYIVLQLQDGQPASTQNILGGRKPTNIGVNVFLATDGKMAIAVGTTSGVFVWNTNGAVFTNGVNETAVLRMRVNFSSGVSCYKNGVLFAGNFLSGTISSPTPSQIATDFTVNMYIGALNDNGTPTSPGGITSIFKVLFMPLQSTITAFPMDAIQEELMSFTWVNWVADEVHVTAANVATQRTAAITAFTNGNGLHTISPTTTTGITGAIHICNTANVSNASSWDRLTFAMNDVDGFSWSHKCYLAHTNQTPNGKLLIVCNGHASDVASGYESMFTQALGYGYDVLYCAMPVVGDNTETNPTITLTSSSGHNQMLSGGLDRVGYSPIELFLFDKFSAINHLNGSYSEIIINGNSGGGWTSCIIGALDERVDITFTNRGMGLRSFKFKETAIDYEQGGMPTYAWTSAIAGTTVSGTRLYAIYTATTFFDLLAMCASSGRQVYRFTHQADDCCFFGTQSWVWMDVMKTLCGTMGGHFTNRVDFNPAYASHMFSAKDITDMFHYLGDL